MSIFIQGNRAFFLMRPCKGESLKEKTVHRLLTGPNNIMISQYNAFAQQESASRNCATILLHASMKLKDGDMLVIRGYGGGNSISLLL